jgi:quinol monooxygenase YgiN
MDNLKEFLQTVHSLDNLIRTVKGCTSHRLYHDVDAQDEYIFVEEWESQSDLDNFMKSDPFSVLLGAMNTLCDCPDIKVNAVSSTAGMDAVQAARSEPQVLI